MRNTISRNGKEAQIIIPQELGAIEAQRFPHLGEDVFDQLDNQTLVACRKVSRPWLVKDGPIRY